MISISRRAIAGLLGITLLVAACGGGDGDSAARDADSRGTAHSGRSVGSEAEGGGQDSSGDPPTEELVSGLNDFAVRFAASEAAQGNLVFSPTSIAMAFALVEAGASEETAAQIAEVFGFPDGQALHEVVMALKASLQEANHTASSDGSIHDLVLELANVVWAQEGLEPGQEFVDTLATSYDTAPQEADFADDPEGSRESINAWVANVTRNRIPELVPQGMITSDTVVALVNAVYLLASWQVPFAEGATSDAPFQLADGSSVQVPTMRQSGLSTTAAQGDGYLAVDLPYEGDGESESELSMTVVVPTEGSLADFEAGLDGARWSDIVASLEPASVDLSLPRWETQSAIDLAGPLSELGLPIPGGDLSGIAPGVSIDAAVHAANITVDETGTEAAAATAVTGVVSAPADVLTVTVDRPFLYVVRHPATGTPLFYGRVLNPAGG
jgi:serpin B